MVYVDATCPLVSKVHIEAERHHAAGLQIIMIGHAGHPETIGTMGRLPAGEVLLVETPVIYATRSPRDASRLAYVTQTTLSVDDTAISSLPSPRVSTRPRRHLLRHHQPARSGQGHMAAKVDAMLVVGAPSP